VKKPETLDIVLKDTFVLLLKEFRQNAFPIVAEGCVPDIVPERNGFDQVLVQVQESADGPCNFGNQLHMEYAVCDVVVFDEVENLRLVDVTAVAVGMDDPIRVMKKIWTDVFGFCVKAKRVCRFAGIGGKGIFLVL
jgi:hypothetical protein